MSNMIHKARVLSRNNLFNIPMLQGISFVGSSNDYDKHLYCFQSRFYSCRCAFTLLRALESHGHSVNLQNLYAKIYKVRGEDAARDAAEIAKMCSISPYDEFDRHSPQAREVVRAWAKYETDYDLSDGELQEAQLSIL